ncbi:VOC family protein [Paracoccus suum]|uniref:VOC family protein n=2 Tax=Paracoccus suum TaxID=2259340 RepID=A0A344PPL8_9RHOB|nr:VOC family protein [Paracoccus suum]
MAHPVKGVDHLFLLTADLDGSAAKWRRMGFTISPCGTHSPAKGTANYTIIFERDYFELLGIVAETSMNQHQREMIARDGDGLRAIACRIDDARVARDALAEFGIATAPVAEFARPLPLPDGSTGEAAFATAHFAKEEVPAGIMFMCQHKTRDMVWRPELQSHANGARALGTIFAVSDDPEQAAAGYARLFAAGQVLPSEDGYLVSTGSDSASILCLRPEAAAARWSPEALAGTPPSAFAALRILVRDLAGARAALASGGVPVTEGLAGGVEGLWVAPSETSGVILEFAEA